MKLQARVPRLRGLVTTVGVSLLLAVSAGCEEEAPPPKEVIRPVKIMEIMGVGRLGTREYPGRIKAGQYSEMSFEVPGQVIEFVYTEGSAVEKGAVLARLDPRDYQSRLDSAVARMEHARSERDRYKVMYEKQVKPYAEYEMRLKQYDVTAAEAREAQKAVDDTVLRAPFDGVMARKLVEEFENVVAKLPVLVMQNDAMLEIKINVPERDLAARGPRVETEEEISDRLNPRVIVSSLPGRSYPARLKELANVADPATRTFEATLVFEKPEDVSILGGMTAKVVIDVPADRGVDGVLVPANAVVSDGGAPSVWIIDPETMAASRREVEIGELTGDELAVTKGLDAGDWIATSGVHQLRDGMVVRRFEP